MAFGAFRACVWFGVDTTASCLLETMMDDGWMEWACYIDPRCGVSSGAVFIIGIFHHHHRNGFRKVRYIGLYNGIGV